MILSRLALAWAIFLGLPATAWAGETFLERNGVVSIEAEHYTERQGAWAVVKGRNAALPGSAFSPDGQGQNAMTIKRGAFTDHLRYAIHFSQPGSYRLWLLGRAGDRSDEVRIFFKEEAASSIEATVSNVTLPERLGWSDEIRSVTVKRPGWHRLLLVQGKAALDGSYPRGSRWVVDKVVLAREPAADPSGEGPEETVNRGQVEPPESVARLEDPLTDEAWELRNGFLVIEAEPLRASGWCVEDRPAGFTGAGYLVWRGCDRSEDRKTWAGVDQTGTEQGPADEWLIIRLKVHKAGRYRVDLRNYHFTNDGNFCCSVAAKDRDIDCWVGVVGRGGLPEAPVRRSGDSLKDGAGFSWLDWGVQAFDLKAGENTLYVAGRSPGFGIDRIAIYRDGDEAAKAKALNPATPDNLPTE
ncbi:MAG: hypothetical protein EHM61_26540 [Acidobacteria bacterium]|nr:MAG: hypothetical protein EHM61_26540 [Acidobacteriota bacterium]